MSSNAAQEGPVVTFGIIADVQYADCEDGTDFSKSRQRFYRNSLNLVKNAVNDWKSNSDPVAFILQLGDLIDGKNKLGGELASRKALKTALNPLNSLRIPVYHVIGNHELYNLNRSFYLTSPLNSSLSLSIQPPTNRLYYTFLPHPKLRVVALDSYEVSLLGYGDNQEDVNYLAACAMFPEKNPNTEANDTSGLQGLERRWAAFNGGISSAQMTWLSQVLEKAQEKEENVIIISHIGLQNEIKDYGICLLWNYDEVMSVVHRYRCVVGVFAGHEHIGYDCVDDHGVQHITFPGVIETRPGSNCYATARMWRDKLVVSGVGIVPSFTIPLRYPV
ncbi:manganese-dependent ADP-ribose/CDP-alcohol diphosphatase [Aplysia californica]|uniref:Manganese-dependent ADP-ribose/CDP-alcohol diphosphatase n=1 Tax=Aplysia californica TaxID=6500 RepID=A0ABM1VQ10_APLCA|nr:manganese-dependent ADP-ribose/CDP-alcohol diphosphatase [Aplysia californica]XP_035824501.1 manganese-dependent ADP-ribose/CDP-alcohol diphosphatase [Aplysia californica]XP_035824502.1 manganese-dependent ADP-ribose/CDP-alcohol diphosphatase [Aplysia californica]